MAAASASGNRQALLSDQEAAELDPERGILVEGSHVTRSEVAADVQGALAEHPREAIKWIEEYGAACLGSFRIHVRTLPKQSGNEIWQSGIPSLPTFCWFIETAQ